MEEIIDKVNKSGKQKFLIIDGNSIMNRAFYGIRLLSTKDGLFTNAIYGFLNIYYMMVDKLSPDYVGVAFDLKDPTFRHEMYDQYKAGRKGMPDELKVQMPIIKEVLTAMNVPILEIKGYEADDILGTVSKKNSRNNIFTYILTGDRDSYQLISETTYVVLPSSKMGKTEYNIYNIAELKNKLDISPNQVIDVKALMGDSSDNIPGVSGIGEKTAYHLVGHYDNLENIYEKLENGKIDATNSVKTKLTQGKDIAFISKKLATIDVNVPINIDYSKLIVTDVNLPELTSLFTRLSFKKFLDKYTKGQETNSSGMKLDIQTNAEKNFFTDFEKSNFEEVMEKNRFRDIINSIMDTTVLPFIYISQDTKINDITNNILAIKIANEKYIYINLDAISENLISILKLFCECDIAKIGYDIKPFFNFCLKNGIDQFNKFSEDIKIEYHLLHSNETNYSIENILYKELGVNFPGKENDDNVKEHKPAQTSLFDSLSDNSMDDIAINKKLSTNYEKKYIFTYLNAIQKCNDLLLKKVNDYNMQDLLYKIEMPLIETLANIENAGMYVDTEKLLAFGDELSSKINVLENDIINIAGESFNINSPMQLGKMLFEKLGLPVIKKTKSGYSTDKETLELLSDKHEIINMILDYRTMAKLKSTYVDGLVSTISSDGRIHTTFMQTVTSTGRLSSIEPNLQNIPVRTELGSKIRDCFTAENNNIIVDADYSQIELRILAHMSNDGTMIKAFSNNDDIHSITASQVFDIPLNKVTHELRSKAKAVNFGIVYGISGYGLAKNIGATRNDAQTYIDNYLTKYNKVKEYMTNNILLGKEKGYVSTMFGRIRFTDELKNSNKNIQQFGERIAMNTPIQGTAADIIKIAMNNIYHSLKEQGLKSKIIMQVHDELIIEAVPQELELVKQILKDKMETVVTLNVPLNVDINCGKTWSEAK